MDESVSKAPGAPLALGTSNFAPKGYAGTEGKGRMNILRYPFELDSFHGNQLSQ